MTVVCSRILWKHAASGQICGRTVETGNKDAKWLLSVKEAILRRVPTPSKEVGSLISPKQLRFLLKEERPKRIGKYWWKRARELCKGVIQAFLSISESNMVYPTWFSEGRMRLKPKPGEFQVTNNISK